MPRRSSIATNCKIAAAKTGTANQSGETRLVSMTRMDGELANPDTVAASALSPMSGSRAPQVKWAGFVLADRRQHAYPSYFAV